MGGVDPAVALAQRAAAGRTGRRTDRTVHIGLKAALACLGVGHEPIARIALRALLLAIQRASAPRGRRAPRASADLGRTSAIVTTGPVLSHDLPILACRHGSAVAGVRGVREHPVVASLALIAVHAVVQVARGATLGPVHETIVAMPGGAMRAYALALETQLRKHWKRRFWALGWTGTGVHVDLNPNPFL